MSKPIKLKFDLGTIVNGCIVLAFLCLIYKFCLNYPNAFDDIYLFLDQFQRQFLSDKNNFFDKITHFFRIAHAPHPKLSSRIINYFTYIVNGEVNFAWIKLIGNLGLLGLIYYLAKLSKVGFGWALVPVVCLLLVPSETTIWAIFISGFPFLIMAILATFQFAQQQKYLLFTLLLLISTYLHGSGFLAVIVSAYFIAVNSFYKKYSIREILIFSISSLITLAIFFSLSYISSNGHGGGGPRAGMLARVIYFFNFISLAFSKVVFLNYYPKVGYVFGAIFIIPVVKANIDFLLNKQLSQSKTTLTLLANFLLSVMVLATFIRFQGTTALFHKVAPRYELYSALLLATSYLILMEDMNLSSWKKKVQLIIICGSLLLFGLRLQNNLKLLNRSYINKVERTFHRLDGNEQVGFVSKAYTKSLRRAYDANLYSPTFIELQSTEVLPTENVDQLEIGPAINLQSTHQQFDKTILLMVAIPKINLSESSAVHLRLHSQDDVHEFKMNKSQRKEYIKNRSNGSKRHYHSFETYFNYEQLDLTPSEYNIDILVIDTESNINKKKSYFYGNLMNLRIEANEY